MRIDNHLSSTVEQNNRVDKTHPQAADKLNKKNAASPPNRNGVPGDIEGLVKQLETVEVDRSQLLADVRERIAAGDYLTHQSAERTAKTILQSLREA